MRAAGCSPFFFSYSKFLTLPPPLPSATVEKSPFPPVFFFAEWPDGLARIPWLLWFRFIPSNSSLKGVAHPVFPRHSSLTLFAFSVSACGLPPARSTVRSFRFHLVSSPTFSRPVLGISVYHLVFPSVFFPPFLCRRGDAPCETP